MGKLLFLSGIIILFAVFLFAIGLVFWDASEVPSQNQSEMPAQNTSIIDELKAMPEQVDDSTASAQDRLAVTVANNEFSFDFYNNIKDKEEGNIFFSPYSISTALAMTYEGAKGQTKEEMKEVFHYPEDEVLRRGNAATYNIINKEDKNYSLSTANALWAEKTYAFLDDYFSTIETYYGGRVVNLDFKNDPDPSRLTINAWVEEQTNYKIKDLLPPNSVGSDTRLVLTNAIYFKGKWESEFEEENTQVEDFETKNGVVQVSMMKQTENFGYAGLEGLQVLELDYQGEDLSMLVLLPEENLDNISLTYDNLNLWRSYIREKEVAVSLPKFKFEKEYSLNQNLKELGMPTAFTTSADFSGIAGTRDLAITDVVHKAFVEVNEEGTEAAAATGVVVGLTSMPDIKVFIADHPFIFIIQEKASGNILFMGRVENPVA